MNVHDANADDSSAQPQWKPIDRVERRVLGVLVEKAKTTPENYPLSLAALVTGSNQKSNRDPQMQLDEDDALVAIDRLRGLGAVREVQGSGRVVKYRHAAYEWLGVDAAGAAIMTELLLRGAQTMGELRARASRMHDFPSLDDVQSTLDQLTSQGLVQAVSPPGRGQVFAHALYPPNEQQYLAQKILGSDPQPSAPTPTAAVAAAPAVVASQSNDQQWQQRLEKLEAEVAQLRARLDVLES